MKGGKEEKTVKAIEEGEKEEINGGKNGGRGGREK